MCTVGLLVIANMRLNEIEARLRHRNMALRARARGVCRKLFQAEGIDRRSHADMLNMLREELEKESRDRWNFDFQKEKPLPGRYEWVPVGVPEIKQDPNQPSSSDEEVRIVDEVTSSNQTTSESSKSPTQTKITDFMKGKKRLSSDLESSPKIKQSRSITPPSEVDKICTSKR